MFQTTNDLVQASEEYGNGYYVGTVTNNNDPLGIGRVQANVPGLYDTALGEVPWIGPKKDSPFGFGTSTKNPYGTYGSPQVGSTIKVELQNGDEHKPFFSPLYTTTNANPTFASPLVWGFQDPDGNMVIYNMSTHTYTFITAGGASIVIDGNGKRTTAVNGDVENSNGDWTINVTGNASINSTGNTTVHAQANATVQADANIAVQAGGTATYTATAHNFVGPISASATITAAGDITDTLGTGNSQTMADMREAYNIHTHTYDDDGHPNHTEVPDQQIP